MGLRLGIAIAATVLAVAPSLALAQDKESDYDAAWRIVRHRCAFCHTLIPQEDNLNFGSQPGKGITFDSAQDMQKYAPQILAFAVQSKIMPPDNATHITDEERAALKKWIEAGARIP